MVGHRTREMLVYDRFQGTNDQVLINLIENNHNYHVNNVKHYVLE